MKYIIITIILVSIFLWFVLDKIMKEIYNEWYYEWWKFACEQTFYADWIDFIPEVWCWDKEANSNIKNIYEWKRK